MKKLFSLLLALILVFSLIPTAVFAETDASSKTATTQQETKKKDKHDKDKHDKDKHDKDKHDKDEHHKDKHKKKKPVLVHKPNQHSYNGYGFDTQYHWLECACGCKISMENHVDPKETSDDCCICGYVFSDNADLVTLWIGGCPPIKGFDKNKTEYELDAYTYKDVKEIEISVRTFDSQATVELPEDLTLKEGTNKFEIKVTAENQKVTKIYTVIVNKDVKK